MIKRLNKGQLALVAGSVLALGVGAFLHMQELSDHAGLTAEDMEFAPTQEPALIRPTAPASTGPVKPPRDVGAALELGDAALLREPIPAELMGGIVCGEVSPTGNPADYRRFVYNGAGRTGGIDDGSEVFRKFADKICLMQPAR